MTQVFPFAYTGEPFFTPAELGARLQTTIANDDPTALLLSTLASDAVRDDLRQTVDVIANDVVTLYGDGGSVLLLPERPVISVSSVIIDGQALNPVTSQPYVNGSDVPLYDWRPTGTLERVVYPGSYYAGQLTWAWPDSVSVIVTYTHGYEVVPTAFKSVALEVAAAGYSNPEMHDQERIGWVEWATKQPSMTLTTAQSARLDPYRRLDP